MVVAALPVLALLLPCTFANFDRCHYCRYPAAVVAASLMPIEIDAHMAVVVVGVAAAGDAALPVIPALLPAGNGRSGNGWSSNGWSGNGCLAKDEGTFRLWEGHSTIILRTVVMIMIVAVVAVVVEGKNR